MDDIKSSDSTDSHQSVPPSNDFEAHNFLGGSNFQGEKEKRN